MPRWVTGIPAEAGAATALVIPDLARPARPRAREQLLATPPEHERITALQPGDDPSHHRLLDEEGADPRLWDRGPTRLLPDVEAFGLRPA